ncbi:hypothetical protein [Methanoculleus sp. 7T]|uniref:hypothetical protein n=1 Tax=Methanoculleus sp. 7T TaxID=2937282 RepID=UPI0020BE023F|nr:hypothetical protein [Methanoculleus sp. 7T]MCK8517670.1 hypothetical protein [Methanoculleus sp. 7T]
MAFNGEIQVAIGYKEKNQKGEAKYRVIGYYFSGGVSTDEFVLELKGLNLNGIHDSLLTWFYPRRGPLVRDLREAIALRKETERQTALCDLIDKR